MDSDNIIEYLPRHPDEQMRLAIQIMQKAYREKTESMTSEVGQMKELYKERQQDIQELKTSVSNLESQMQKKDKQIKSLSDENVSISTENNQLALQVKKLNQELAKLNKFRMNIIKSINQETLADDLSEPLGGVNGLEDMGAHNSIMFSSFNGSTTASPSNRQITSPSNRSVGIMENDYSEYGSPSQAKVNHFDGSDQIGIERQGREFFHRAKAELNFKQFNQFLVIIKKLNTDALTTAQCLAQAKQIFGPQHAELTQQFENLLEKQKDSDEQ